MSKTLSSFSAGEALEMMKANFPNDYQERIEVGKQLLIRLKRTYNTESFSDAYLRYKNSGCSDESGIMMLCALQALIDQERKDKEAYKNSIYGMIEDRDNLLSQQEHNETSTTTNETDKKLLRQFYRTKIDQLNEQINQYCHSIEVVDPIVVNTPNLFTGHLSA